ncbi:MAG: hypothetical protein VB013_08055 [Anaerolineaceae bacterium]|nr:hypothetical protein [Anaerolineaceae bacterium]
MTLNSITRVKNAINQRWKHALSDQRWKRLKQEVTQNASAPQAIPPVVFFNSSTRLQAISQNAAYSFLTLQALRLQGVPVIQFACNAGLTRCTLGSNRDDVNQQPPCERCVAQSHVLFDDLSVRWFEYKEDSVLAAELEKRSVEELMSLRYQEVPLGFWAVNSLRWVLRRHHLQDDAPTRAFLRHYILSGWNVYQQFSRLAEEVHPQAVVEFNGMFYPEAAIRFVCLQKGIRVITHEVGLRPFTAFFTDGEATAYPIHISPEFQLTPAMDERLDQYLSERFKGNFSMAGIRFWPEMKGLDAAFLEKASHFKQIVPVFTNVIFDTSQVHANTIFADMFIWLDNVKDAIEKHPETLFVIRAHPDEFRAGKEARESVSGWVKQSKVDQLPNVVFVDSQEFLSSYDLIQRSHFVMVYNSTIGLEAILMGKVVLAGGKARFTQLETAYLPKTLPEYDALLEKFLTEPKPEVPAHFIVNARRFLYYQLYLSSLPFDEFLREDGVWKGYVTLKDFPLSQLTPAASTTLRVLSDGILRGSPFEMPL